MHQCYTQRLHSGCTHPPPSFQRDPALRPTAHALCEYRFFKQARDKAYIQKHLLQGGWVRKVQFCRLNDRSFQARLEGGLGWGGLSDPEAPAAVCVPCVYLPGFPPPTLQASPRSLSACTSSYRYWAAG